MQNSELLREVYGPLDTGTFGWVTNFRADPNSAGVTQWAGRSYNGTPAQQSLLDSVGEDNTFFCTSVMKVNAAGTFKRGKANFLRLAVLVADDADPETITSKVSYVFETSPGNYQIGILLDEDDADCRDLALVDAVMQAMAKAHLVKADSSGNNAVRYVRLPVGHNTKARASGPWRVVARSATLSVRLSLEDAAATFGIDLDSVRASLLAPSVEKTPTGQGQDYAALITSLAADDPSDRAYHDPLLKLSAKFVSAGMHGGAAVETLRGLMLAVKPRDAVQLARWQSRYDEIPRLVSGAEKKYKAPVVEIALPGTEEERQGLLMTLPELGEKTKNVKWLVKSLIPADAMGMLFGASGTFKSFIALDLAMHVAHAMKWCNRKMATGSVVYVAAEGGAGIYRRVRAWHQHHKLSTPDNFHVCVTPLLLAEEDQVSALREAISSLPRKPSLVVVDTLSQTFTGDENSSTDVAAYLRLLNTHLRAAFGATVLVIHHTGHMASERPRGSSAITANLDFLLGCFRPNAESLAAQVEVIKQKDGDKLAAQYFELHREVLEKDEDGEEVSSLTAAWHDAVAACKESALKLNPYEQAFYDAMPDGTTVHEDDLKAILAGMVDNAETRRKYWKRTMSSLQEKRMVRPAGIGMWKRV